MSPVESEGETMYQVYDSDCWEREDNPYLVTPDHDEAVAVTELLNLAESHEERWKIFDQRYPRELEKPPDKPMPPDLAAALLAWGERTFEG
jgi:hypothetical protein